MRTSSGTKIPGNVPSRVPAMHWDPGPYWDWEHYFDLLGAPIADAPGRSGGAVAEGRGIRVGDVVTVAPGYDGNANPLTGCGETPCETGATNFVYLRQAPDAAAPLVNDPGLNPGGEPQTTRVSDIGARVAAGQQLVVAERRPGWVGVWWLGALAWMPERNAAGEPTARTDRGRVVVPRGDEAVPVYGRAYPEASAYPDEIPVQDPVPLQYEVRPGQAYALADRDPQSGYYYAKSFQCATVPGDCTHVEGDQDYVQIWFGHRYVYALADDVRVRRG